MGVFGVFGIAEVVRPLLRDLGTVVDLPFALNGALSVARYLGGYLPVKISVGLVIGADQPAGF